MEVLNAGVSGYSTAEEYLRLTRELQPYEPDVVLVGFYGNDIVDNVRSGLFKLEGDQLVEARRAYVPGGRFANFLNTNWFFSLLAERSNAFVLLKERGTQLMRKQMVEDNIRNVEEAEAGGSASAATPRDARAAYGRRLTAAIFERFYAAARERGQQLAILSIPWVSPPAGGAGGGVPPRRVPGRPPGSLLRPRQAAPRPLRRQGARSTGSARTATGPRSATRSPARPSRRPSTVPGQGPRRLW